MFAIVQSLFIYYTSIVELCKGPVVITVSWRKVVTKATNCHYNKSFILLQITGLFPMLSLLVFLTFGSLRTLVKLSIKCLFDQINFGQMVSLIKGRVIGACFWPHGVPHMQIKISIDLYQEMTHGLSFPVELKISLLSSKGEKIYTREMVSQMESNYVQNGFSNFITRDSLFNKDLNLLPNDTLTILSEITIQLSITNRDHKFENLSHPFDCQSFNYSKQLFKSRKFSDVIFNVCGTQFFAHKAIISFCSPVFDKVFTVNMKEKKEAIVQIAHVDADVFEEMLSYIYTGETPNLEQKAVDLLIAANYYQIHSLKCRCENIIIKNITVKNAVETFLLAEVHNANHLQTVVFDFIDTHAKEIFNTSECNELKDKEPPLKMKIIKELIKAISLNDSKCD